MADDRLHLAHRLAVSYDELAQLTGVGKSTLRRWASELEMPVCRIRGTVLIVIQDWMHWVREFSDGDGADPDAAVQRILSEIRSKEGPWESR